MTQTLEAIHIGNEEGVLVQVNEPSDLDSMHRYVTEHARDISVMLLGRLFVLLTFDSSRGEPKESCLKEEGWYPVHPRTLMQNASEWHAHYPVIIYCPKQEEVVIPTGVTTHRLLVAAEEKTRIRSSTGLDRSAMLRLNAELEMFRPDDVQNSGYTLILNDGTVHAKLPMPDDFQGKGGIVQRRTWESV